MSEHIPLQLHLSICPFLVETVSPVRNQKPSSFELAKPCGGLWTSTYDPHAHSAAWVDWLAGQGEYIDPRSCYWFLLTPIHNAKVYTIDSHNDLTLLLNRYPRAFSDRSIKYRYIDFEAMSQRYDALHLTTKGQQMTSDESDYANLSDWSVECTLWFRWCFTEVQRIAGYRYAFSS